MRFARTRRACRAGGACLAGAALAVAAAAALSAQPLPADYPNKPIRIVVPFAPGGPVDVVGRLIMQRLTVSMGQPFVLDNRGGGGSALGAEIVAKSPADGYTWLLNTGSQTSIAAFNENVTFDAIRDFTPVTMAARNFGQVLIVHPGVAAKTVQELIALAKARPGKLNYASAGIGNITYIAAEMMKVAAGVQILDIQYKGTGPATGDLLGGHVDMLFSPTQTSLQLIQTGRVRALAMTGSTRWKMLPEVPTMQEAGFKDYDLVGWFGLWLPAGASPALVKRIYDETARALTDAELRQRFDDVGLEAVGMPTGAFAKFCARDAAAMRELARKIGYAARQ
jgi:tripartite-type tricarboxylate transporter receptor subunit TctC